MRRFLFSGSLISALLGVTSVLRATKSGPRDWRLLLLWISWGITVALAIGSVLQTDKEREQGK